MNRYMINTIELQQKINDLLEKKVVNLSYEFYKSLILTYHDIEDVVFNDDNNISMTKYKMLFILGDENVEKLKHLLQVFLVAIFTIMYCENGNQKHL